MENKSSTCHMTKQRLIDANEALRMIVNSKVDNPFQIIRGQGEIWKKAHDCVIDCVKNAPTVDAVEVVYGEWLVKAYTVDDSIVVIPYRKHQHNEPFCSRCGHYALLNCGEYVTSNYCPNCGAKMDGGNEDG